MDDGGAEEEAGELAAWIAASVAVIGSGAGADSAVEATAAGMGHLVVMDDSEAQFALTRYSQQLWDEVSAELPREVEHDACGTIWIAA